MLKTLLATTALLTAIASLAAAATPMTSAELDHWLNNYYLKPSPELVSAALLTLDQSGRTERRSAAVPLAVFMSRLVVQSPEVIGQLAGELPKLSTNGRRLVARALWLANTPAAVALLPHAVAGDPIAASTIQQPVPQLEQLPINTPEAIDSLWGAFFASGDKRYLQRIIAALPDGAVHSPAVLQAAVWSLGSNIDQHPLVRRICQEVLAEKPGDELWLLRSLLGGDTALGPVGLQRQELLVYRNFSAAADR